MADFDWREVLETYEYPKRPCDTNCVDGCPARPSCPLFQAWYRQTKRDAKKQAKNKEQKWQVKS